MILSAMRRKAQQALSGQLGPRAQQMAWRVAALHPRLGAVQLFKRGAIRAPLAALQRGHLGSPEAAQLRDRLADMAAFCDRGGDRTPAPERTGLPPFDGRVLYALHSCGAYDANGYASRSVALIGAAARHGVQPTLTTRPGYPWDLLRHHARPRVPAVEHRGLRFELVPHPQATLRDPESRYVEAYSAHLQTLARRDGATLIHAASNYLNGAAAAAAGRALGIASVYELRGLWHLTRAFNEPGYGDSEHFRYCELREVSACAAVDRVVTLSPGLADWLVERGIPASKIRVVGNASPAAPEATPERAARARALRQRWGIPADATVLGYLGSLVPYEGLDALLRAQRRTAPARRPTLLLVGSGAHEPELRQLAAAIDGDARVVFAGHVAPAEVPACYAAMDAVVLPRRDDPLTRLVPAIKPFEALAHRRPLLVSAPLAQALGSTLASGYRVVDLDAVDGLDRLAAELPPVAAGVAVPSWDDRARELLAVYRELAPPSSSR